MTFISLSVQLLSWSIFYSPKTILFIILSSGSTVPEYLSALLKSTNLSNSFSRPQCWSNSGSLMQKTKQYYYLKKKNIQKICFSTHFVEFSSLSYNLSTCNWLTIPYLYNLLYKQKGTQIKMRRVFICNSTKNLFVIKKKVFIFTRWCCDKFVNYRKLLKETRETTKHIP